MLFRSGVFDGVFASARMPAHGAFGVMPALCAREKTGRGQFIDLGLHDGIFRFIDARADGAARS